MRGSIQTLSAGRWLVRVDAGRHPVTGKRRQPSRVVHGSRRTAELALEELKQELRDHPLDGPGSVTVDQLVELWLSSPNRSGRMRSPASRYATAGRMRRDVLPHLGTRKASTVTTIEITRLCDGLLDGRGLSPTTVRLVWSELRAMFAWAVRRGYVRSNPATSADVPAQRLRPPTTISRRDLCAHLDVLASEDPDLELVFLLAASFGLRRSEIAALRWAHVDLHNRNLSIREGLVKVPGGPVTVTNTKTGHHGFGDYPVHEELARRLSDRHDAFRARLATVGAGHLADGYLFSSDPASQDPWRPDSFSRAVARHLQRHPELPGVTLQQLRRFAASDLHEQGESLTTAAAILRDTPETTARHYLALDRQRVRGVVVGIFDRIERDRRPPAPAETSRTVHDPTRIGAAS